jgi:putative iron-dependent peroxidase
MTTTVPALDSQLDDIQGFVASGYGTLTQGRALLLQVAGAASARQLIGQLLQAGLVPSCNDVSSRIEDRRHEVVSVSLSFAGLHALGLTESTEWPFPGAFRQGMASTVRGRLLGDGDNGTWRWGDVPAPGRPRFVAHLLVTQYWLGEAPPSAALLDPVALRGRGFGVEAVPLERLVVKPDGSTTEPFGFADGIAQPVIRGLSKGSARRRHFAAGSMAADRQIAPGEFLLGQVNEYGEPAYCPDLVGWRAPPGAEGLAARFAFNGSYLAVRQIGQDVTAFRAFDAAHPQPPGQPSLAEKMVGRTRSGAPLSACPVAPADGDSFRYRVDDLNGFGCPRGAHVRRANPRDTLGWDSASGVQMSRLHRLLRRGRSYEDEAVTGWPQGLFFMALNADLDRQFEFIQQRWLSGPHFGDLAGETDPLLGPAGRAFTSQGLPAGRRYPALPAFTQVLGGGYFLLPRLAALRALASADEDSNAGGAGSAGG